MHMLATFSIVACDLKAGDWGIAVASKFPAAGAIVPWAQAGVGAVATQALANTSYGPRGLKLMASGLSADDALRKLLSRDADRDNRQVGLVDAKGGSATYTGGSCAEWAGGLSGAGYAIQGNILAGPEVVRAMEHAFRASKRALPERLMNALLAGNRAGGDRRGRQSAALLVVKSGAGYGGHNDRWVDYRVDDDLNPVPRLVELLELHHLYFEKSPRAKRVKLSGEVVKDIQRIMKRLGYYTAADGVYNDATQAAFRTFIHNENFEERADPQAGWIDGPALAYLMKKLK